MVYFSNPLDDTKTVTRRGGGGRGEEGGERRAINRKCVHSEQLNILDVQNNLNLTIYNRFNSYQAADIYDLSIPL